MNQPAIPPVSSPQNSEYERLLDNVSEALQRLAPVAGTAGMSPADIRATVIAAGNQVAAWEVRGALSEIEQRGGVVLQSETGRWFLPDA